MPSRNRAPTLRALAQRRMHLPCRVPGCKRLRDPSRAVSHCVPHAERQRLYAHPLGRKILKKEYAVERDAVAALFAAHPDHEGVRNACEWIRRWLDASIAGDKQQPGYIHVARLHRGDVQPLTVLIEVCAVWLYAMRYPNTLPDDERLTFALAVGMLYLARRDYIKSYHYQSGERRKYREANYSDRRAIGEHLRLNLARLLVNVAQTIEQQQQATKDAAQAMSLPFVVTHPSTEGNEP